MSGKTTAFNENETLSASAAADIESRTQVVGRELFANLDHRPPHILQRQWWDDRIMQWAMHDEAIKVQMFRFVDVLPMLKNNDAILRNMREYFGEVRERLPAPIRWIGGLLLGNGLTGHVLASITRKNAMSQARRFIAGTNVKEVLATALSERNNKRAFTLDLLGEAVTSESEAEQYQAAYLQMLRELSPSVNSWAEDPQLDRDSRGPLPRVNVSVKLSALDSQFDAIDPEGTTERVSRRLRELLRTAMSQGAHVHIDMESYKTKDLTLHIAKTILMEPEFRDWPNIGVVIQCYLRDAAKDLRELRDWALQRGTPIWVRLVKGAYWDYETVYAGLMDWPVPVWTRKWESDLCYEQMSHFLLANPQSFRTALASHNLRSLAHGIATAEILGIPPRDYEVQMLYGMADAEKGAMTERGLRLRIYMPFGELIPGMAYLVRRLLENTSNDSFLMSGLSQSAPIEQLLRNPAEMQTRSNIDHTPLLSSTASHIDMATSSHAKNPMSPFQSEPPADFAIELNRRMMQDAIASVRLELNKMWPLVIGGEKISTAETIASVNPSRTSEIVGRVASAEAKHVEQAVQTAKKAQVAWAKLSIKARADYLRAIAAEMRQRRWELSAWQVLECGKPWREADGDVCEAIDFCEYYAAGAEMMHGQQGVDLPGEENAFEYIPHGVAAVIAPWNFPLAILTGMTVAALVTGNAVIMKPAEQSSVMAAQLMRVIEAAGLPAGVANFLPGAGEVVGAGLVEHRDVGIIAFTGSRPVGLAIHRRAAEVSEHGTRFVKRVIAEMGGKNAVIIDDNADLDEAVLGVARSAFGYAGQKCSACSRAIVIGDAYDAFVSRLVAAAESFKVGVAEEPATTVGPVIDEESRSRIKNYIEIGKREAKTALAVDIGALAEQGSFVGPHIFTNVSPTSRLAQEEIFGPVLAVIKAKNLDEALEIANGTDYALTGGIFTRSPGNLERVRRELLVGNLYINRAITGALVGRQPFGGFRMSGIGSKAGGPDYLYQFVIPRTITENTLRRGFAPTVEGSTDAANQRAD